MRVMAKTKSKKDKKNKKRPASIRRFQRRPAATTLWTEVDGYIASKVIPRDRALDAALDASEAAGLPAIAVSPAQGKMLHLLASAIRAKAILEIGTLGGYSTIWLARALPKPPRHGTLITLEAEERHADVARANIARAGLADRVEIRVGKALDTLPMLQADGRGPFDFIFIDADKPNIPQYFRWALRLSRPGSLIVVDNVIRGGEVCDAKSKDANVTGVRRFNELLAAEHDVSATTIQTVGVKGYDGFTLALVTAGIS